MRVILTALAFACSMSVQANFLIDYQGLDKQKSAQQVLGKGVPDGFTLLTDKYRAVVREKGHGSPAANTSFGDELDLRDAFPLIVPIEWSVYVDETEHNLPNVSWDALEENWLYVLARIGLEHGLKFVVDWEQSLIQVTTDKNFERVDFAKPIVMEDPNTGRVIYIYKDKNKTNSGQLIRQGKVVAVKVR